ncbi:MAG: 23S rRNA (guanosine(2251)-2'-O)-methyltransferase RlmB [Candidatus Limnocylindrales bacterium]
MAAGPEAEPRTAVQLAAGEELVAGRRPVEEAFAARREAHRLIVVPTRRAALEALVLHATTLRIPVVEVEGGTLTALAGFDGHQGVALVVAPRRWATLDEVIVRALERGERPFVLVLDSLEDPHNVGSLLRTAEAAGVHGVLFPTRHAAPLTPSAIKASAGAVEHLLLVPVDDLPGALADLHGRGLRIVGADAGAALAYREADLRGPLALVIGSEGQGLAAAVRRRLDLAVGIPMSGHIGSLNAAVAGSVLLLEAAGQRHAAAAAAGTSEPAPPEPPTAPDEAAPAATPRRRAPRTKAAAPPVEPASDPAAAARAAAAEAGEEDGSLP